MRKRIRSRGYTLIELLIALLLSSFVLVGAMSVATSMIKFQYDAQRKGKVTGLTLLSLNRMHRELENATFLALPAGAAGTGDILSGCLNYSAILPAANRAIDLNIANIRSFYYCKDASNSLYRYTAAGATSCPYSPAPSCGVTAGFETVLFQNFFHSAAQPAYFFKRSTETAGVELHYRVGNIAPTAYNPTPKVYEIDTRIHMNKSYANSSD